MRDVRRVVVVILCLLGSVLSGQEYYIESFTLDEGVHLSSVRAINQDASGRIWLGSSGHGVDIYNGYSFEFKDLEIGMVSSIFRDQKNNMWIGTSDYVWMYDGQRYINMSDSLKLNSVTTYNFFEDTDGAIWLLRNGELVKFDKGKKEVIPMKNLGAIRDMVIWQNKRYIGTSKGLYYLSQNGIIQENYYLRGQSSELIFDLYVEGGDELWISTEEDVLYVTGRTVESIEKKWGRDLGPIRKFYRNQEGFWMAGRMGVYLFSAGELIHIGEENGLPNNVVYDMHEDHNGNLWFATHDGAAKYTDRSFTYYSGKSGLKDERVFAIKHDSRGNLWTGGTRGYVGVVNGTDNSIDNYYLCSYPIQAILEDSDGTIWVATSGCGLYKVHGRDSANLYTDHYTIESGLLSDVIYDMELDRKGNIWMFSEGGVTIHDRKTKKMITLNEKDGIPDESYYCGHRSKDGNLWLGAWDEGMLKVSINENYQIKEVIHVKSIYPELSTYLLTITEDYKGQLWVGTINDGLFRVWENEKGLQIQNYSEKEGLNSNVLFQVFIDSMGDVWLGDGRGVSRCTFNNNGKLIGYEFFGKERGFLGVETNHNAVDMDDNGRIYWGTMKNVTVFDRSLRRGVSQEMVLNLLGMDIFYNDSIWETHCDSIARWKGVPVNLSLPHDQNHLTFRFEGIDYRNQSDAILYKWKLEGHDEFFTPPSTKREALYMNLPPGDYSFHLKAAGADGKWDSPPLLFNFKVQAPFWGAGWFYACLAIISCLLIWGVIKLREKKFKLARYTLEAKVQQRTAELRDEKNYVLEQQSLLEEMNKRLQDVNIDLERKNLQITDSLNYAKLIQDSILQPVDTLKDGLGDVFILHQPKDIVSGDFYWFKQDADQICLAAADCTGHGVPGAFLSIISHTILDQLVHIKGHCATSEIMTSLWRNLYDRFSRNEQLGLRSSVDASIVKLKMKEMTLEYSGVRNSLLLVRGNEMIEVKPHRVPAGMESEWPHQFECHEMGIQKGDVIYLFTDGYADQPGGRKGKRFGSRRFRDFLMQISHLPMSEQHKQLMSLIHHWRDEIEQYDDILVVGLKI